MRLPSLLRTFWRRRGFSSPSKPQACAAISSVASSRRVRAHTAAARILHAAGTIGGQSRACKPDKRSYHEPNYKRGKGLRNSCFLGEMFRLPRAIPDHRPNAGYILPCFLVTSSRGTIASDRVSAYLRPSVPPFASNSIPVTPH